LPFLNREYRTLLHLDVPHDANSADVIGELYIVPTRFDAGNSQALVVVDRSIPVVLALVMTPAVFPRRRHLETRDCVQGKIPESNALAIMSRHGTAHESERDRSKQHTATQHFLPPQIDALVMG
jgi:hypothetical protein